MGSDAGNGSSPQRQLSKVGVLCSDLPDYVQHPPIESVVFSWGVGEDGALGLDSSEDQATPKVVEALLGTRFRGRQFSRGPLVCGSRNTMAVQKNGQVLAWGWNARGTLGQGHKDKHQHKPRRVKGLSGVRIVQADIGGWHALVLDDQGQAFAFGGNEYGQCGCCFDQRDILVPVPCVPHLKVQQVAAGGMHSLVLTTSGEVWTWGEIWGDFSMVQDRSPRRVEGAPQDIVQIKCGAFHNLALDRQGAVYSWGINDFGQLGTGDTAYATTPQRVVDLEEVTVACVEAGGWHSLALTDQGEVYVWGRGEYGRLGLGDRGGASKLRPQLMSSLKGHNVVHASCGGTHTMVVTDDSRMFVWGRGSFGRLGTGSARHYYSPVEVKLPGGPERWRIIDVSCGGRHSAIIAVPDNGNLRDARSVGMRGGHVTLSGVEGGSGSMSFADDSDYDSDEEEATQFGGTAAAADQQMSSDATGPLAAGAAALLLSDDRPASSSPRLRQSLFAMPNSPRNTAAAATNPGTQDSPAAAAAASAAAGSGGGRGDDDPADEGGVRRAGERGVRRASTLESGDEDFEVSDEDSRADSRASVGGELPSPAGEEEVEEREGARRRREREQKEGGGRPHASEDSGMEGMDSPPGGIADPQQQPSSGSASRRVSDDSGLSVLRHTNTTDSIEASTSPSSAQRFPYRPGSGRPGGGAGMHNTSAMARAHTHDMSGPSDD